MATGIDAAARSIFLEFDDHVRLLSSKCEKCPRTIRSIRANNELPLRTLGCDPVSMRARVCAEIWRVLLHPEQARRVGFSFLNSRIGAISPILRAIKFSISFDRTAPKITCLVFAAIIKDQNLGRDFIKRLIFRGCICFFFFQSNFLLE